MIPNLPSFENYMNYLSSNYGAHSLRFIDHEGRSYWYSYKTLIAVYVPGRGKVVRFNDWGPTTGKHLNAIDGGSKEATAARLDGESFAARVAELLA